MRFFFDENFPKSTTILLHKKGHKVYDIRSTELEGIDDNAIFKIAQNKKALFLTTDKDFYHTIPYLFKNHYGIIIIALRQPNRKKITKKLLFALEHFDLTLFNSKVLLLRDNNFTIINKNEGLTHS